ncbi:hypothetical protein ES708_25282 [subsurface metagenome]
MVTIRFGMKLLLLTEMYNHPLYLNLFNIIKLINSSHQILIIHLFFNFKYLYFCFIEASEQILHWLTWFVNGLIAI